MRVHNVNARKIIMRSLGVLMFAATFCFVSDCHAQQRGFFKRGARMQNNLLLQNSRSQPFQFKSSQYSPSHRNPTLSRILDGPLTRYRDPAEVDSRYTGGFHYNHFQNIGIPSGDIGLRGNAYNWRTW
jgi:hypothetical protein